MGTQPIELISGKNVCKAFELPGGHGEFVVLENASVTVRQGEIVTLLGRSGSGKSTMLRILAGLLEPTSGQVISMGKPVDGPNPDVAIVFQSFALLPWLTVLQNVELGLEALGVAAGERRERALKAIDMVGLDGFESAYPKELSGGMKQRVGFARAFVKRPPLLFFDEPFSALDVLTAENLRGEITDLWEKGSFPSKGVLMVTHNIEEAVILADRVIIMGANPGHIRGELPVNLPRPRDRNAPRFQDLVDRIYELMTNPELKVQDVTPAEEKKAERRYPPLPHARVGGIRGLLELVQERGSVGDLADLATDLRLEVDDLLIIVDAAVMLGFALLADGKVTLTDVGNTFASADVQSSKEIFRKQVLARIPLIQMMVQALSARKSGSMQAAFFEDILDEHFPEEEAERQFKTAVDWGRFAELFEYDATDGWITATAAS